MNVLGPFDEHLVTDVGALFVGLAVLLTIAAVTLAPHDRAWPPRSRGCCSPCPTSLWHLFNLEPYGTSTRSATS